MITSAGSIADVSAIEDRLEGGWEEFDEPRPLDLCEDKIDYYLTPQSDILQPVVSFQLVSFREINGLMEESPSDWHLHKFNPKTKALFRPKKSPAAAKT